MHFQNNVKPCVKIKTTKIDLLLSCKITSLPISRPHLLFMKTITVKVIIIVVQISTQYKFLRQFM